jgi:hypothetical protein
VEAIVKGSEDKGQGGDNAGEDEDEEDPLEAFMSSINEQVRVEPFLSHLQISLHSFGFR